MESRAESQPWRPVYISIRTVYLMLSIFLYNVWMLANVILAGSLGIELKKPVMKLSHMIKLFTMWIERLGDPPH